MTSFSSKMFSALIMCFVFWKAEGVAVMSVDLGSEWMKVAIVSPGVPMEIALNKESQRKTPVAVAFRDGERTFGDSAMSVGVRFPERSFSYVLDVIGKKIDNPLVKLFEKRFPYYSIEPSGDRDTVSFKHPEGLSFSPEELIAMILKQAQDIAQNAAGQLIKDAVITVPPYFCQAERRALLQAAQMSGLNVLQLINGNTAVALNYGIFRRRDFNETSTNILFYDMGAGSTVATVVSYQLVKTKDSNDVNPQLSVKGVGFDRTLGGLDMQLRLRDHFAKAFNAAKNTPTDIFNNSRSMAKLFKEAGRVKKVLSANTDHIAQVESLLDDKDFKCHVSRTEFEELCSDLFDRVTKPIDIALESAGMDMDFIDQVILAGSGTRVPKVQQILLDYIKKSELGKNINTDESAALGAAYQAAHLSKGFKVKTFLVKDANIYPIQVESQREYALEDNSFGQKNVRRTIFSRNNIYPQKKIITFNRYVKDFEFYVNYGELGFLNDLEIQSLGSLNISKVSVSDIEAALEKHAGENTDIKGVKAHFKLDDNGILQIEQVESVFEKIVEDETEGSEYESTLMKLGNTIGRLFSGSADDKDKEKEEVISKEKVEEIADPKNESEISDKKAESKSNINTDEMQKNDTTVKKEPKLITVKEPLNALKLSLDLLDLTEQQAMESTRKLQRLDDDDRSKLAKEKSKNSLESFVLETGQKLYMKDYELASTEDERNIIRDSLTKVGEWLDYDSSDATTEVFVSKLSELKILTKSLFERVKEHQERPEALNALNEMLNLSDMFLSGARNMSEEEQIFTDVEMKTLEKLIIDTKEWKSETEKEQEQLPLTYAPKLTTKIISEKIANLDREVKYLLNKARFAAPLKKKKMPNETKEEKLVKNNVNDTIIDAETDKSTENLIDQGNEYKDSDLHATEEVVTAETTSKEEEINDDTISIEQTHVPKEKNEDNDHSEL